MQSVHVIGLGVDHQDLPEGISRRIEGADVLVGGIRLLEAFKNHPAVKIAVKSPLDKIVTRIKQKIEANKEVIVLADGDPGFFGIGKTLIRALGEENVQLYPNVTVLQAAAAKLKMPWEKAKTVSLHGRQDLWPLFRALVNHDLVGVFTDQTFHPGKIADALVQRGVDTFRMHIFENLGMKDESIKSVSPDEAKDGPYASLSFVLLERTKSPEIQLRLGLDDELYFHERGLITKKELRVVGLSQLEIQPHHTVWDLGAGCGSVAIEASLLAYEGEVVAVEKDAFRVKSIQKNIQKTGAYGVQIIHDSLPDCLDSLPEPDRIFIGGGTGHGINVLEQALERLKPGGNIVLHLVLMGSLERARNFLLDLGWPVNITQVQICRSESLAGDQRFEALNPVFILSASKPTSE